MRHSLAKVFLAFTQFIVGVSSAEIILRSGNPNDVQVKKTEQVICLAGGRSDDGWVQGWRELLKATHGGDLVVLRATIHSFFYNEWVYDDIHDHDFPKLNSVTTIILTDKNDAQKEEIKKLLDNAEMIFIAGGDQNRYVDWFSKTPIEAALNEALHKRKIPIAGTSAGMAILAQYDFEAHFNSPHPDQSYTSEDVLAEPLADFVDVRNTIVEAPFLENVITDTHFSNLQREGRLAAFMAHALVKYKLPEIKAIASDESTAFCYDEKGLGRVYGPGNVYFIKATKRPELLKEHTPLIWIAEKKAIQACIVNGDANKNSFDLPKRQGDCDSSEYWWVDKIEGKEKTKLYRQTLR